ncbi:MAG: hypothetical protein JXB25_06125 [Deltaproteobacteria bacterium]|nr:hypothetical protein [Deltaproteobacteria bacterium]
MNFAMGFPVEAEDLIPHRLPMRLIEALESYDGVTGVVRARSGSDHPFREENGVLAEAALVELIAQSFAAVQGFADRQGGGAVRRGFLVGARRIGFYRRPRPEDELRVVVHAAASFESFAIVEGKVLSGEETLAEGNIKVWIASREESPF